LSYPGLIPKRLKIIFCSPKYLDGLWDPHNALYKCTGESSHEKKKPVIGEAGHTDS
jgi:hypothetical protein